MNRTRSSHSKSREVEMSRARSASLFSLSPARAADKEVQGHPWSLLQILWSVIQWIVMLTVGTIVLYFQITNWPQATSIYYTDDPWDNMRGGLAYTCGCSLPSNLQSTDPTNVQASQDKGNLNVCYESSSLETVTILMYSNSTAASDLNSFFSTEKTTIEYTTVEGYNVSQEAHDLTNNLTTTWLPDEAGYDFKSLFLGRYMQPDIQGSLGYLQGAQFNSFPTSYVRMGLHYTCNNCATCDINKVNKIGKRVVDSKEDWATCFFWRRLDNDQCPSDFATPSYEAKCLFYPTETIPANFALQRFLQLFLNQTELPGIGGVTPVDNMSAFNYTSFQPSFLYLNISQVEKSSIGLGFVEVVHGSSLWVSLLNLFPSLDKECHSLAPVSACNGTSICNAFANSNSYDVRCFNNITDQSRCQELISKVRLSADNVRNMTEAGSKNEEIVCPSFNCQNVPPYLAIWNTSQAMESDALNQFLSTKILNQAWAQQSGVCTNTYSNVFRYNPPVELGTVRAGGASTSVTSDKRTMFLEANCTSATSNMSRTYCWLTGQYHSLTDSPESPLKNLSDDLFSDPKNRFVCYRVHKQKFVGWFINIFGVLFGWLGSVQLLFQVLLWIVKKVKREREERNTSPVFPGAPGK